jgi:hypothetical protein
MRREDGFPFLWKNVLPERATWSDASHGAVREGEQDLSTTLEAKSGATFAGPLSVERGSHVSPPERNCLFSCVMRPELLLLTVTLKRGGLPLERDGE